MSTPLPLNSRLAQAMIAARMGYALPAAMGEGPRGRLFERRMQEQIAARLPPAALAHYRTLRDRVREAVAAARAGDATGARALFATAEAHLAVMPALSPDASDATRALGRSWIDQGAAYHALRQGDTPRARAHLLSAMDADERLEAAHGFNLMHIGRVHTVHLWLRVLMREGDEEGARAIANAILAYVTGTGTTLPVGAGWGAEQAAAVPSDLRTAMACRIASEIGALLAGLAPDEAASALTGWTALDALAAGGVLDSEAVAEILAWRDCKRAWAAGDSEAFLLRAVPILRQGRRETALWYAVLLDLCRTAQALRPQATAAFVQDMAEQAGADDSAPEILPVALRHALATTPAAPALYRHVPATRHFHLICLGLPRSGTTSLYTLFARHRAGNEYAESATITALVAHGEGRIDDAALDAGLLRRDHESSLEMDAASFLHLAADRLPALFPTARFVIPVRDPADWFDSYLGMLLRWHDGFASQGKAPPAWMAEYGRLLFGSFTWTEIATEEARTRHVPQVAERFLAHWATATSRVLDLAPRARRLVLRTEALSHRLGALADFAGVPRATLTDEHHANARPPGPVPAGMLDPRRLAEMRDDLCARVLERVNAEAAG